jgi:hypothetical protein
MIAQFSEPQRQQFYEYVDESAYSLADWEQAWEAFDGWLSEQKVTARPIDSMLGYLHCCTLSNAETLSAPNLADQVKEMLNLHGFDAASPAGADEAD